MFPQLKKINNESGIVLFIVLMTAIIIMIMSVGILTQSMNEINYAQQQIDQITADQLSKGIFWSTYSTAAGTSNALPAINTWQNESGENGAMGRNYEITINPGPTVNGITSYSVVANYDTF